MVARATSMADGYHVMAGVAPGDYLLRISLVQLARLGLSEVPPQRIHIAPDGGIVNGKDSTTSKPGSDHDFAKTGVRPLIPGEKPGT